MPYPSILQLRRVPELLALKNLVVMEKIHGTGSGIVINNSAVQVRISGEHYPGQNTFLHDRPGLEQKLKTLEGHVHVYGEYAGEGVLQKTIKYGQPEFYAFDIEIAGMMQDYGTLQNYCGQIGLMMAPILADIKDGFDIISNQKITKLEDFFENIRNRPSKAAELRGIKEFHESNPENMHEGIVIKCNPPQKHGEGYLMAKFKSDRYREDSKEIVLTTNTTAVYAFARTYVNENRVLNILSHGVKIDKAPWDIKKIVPLVIEDLIKEEQEEIDKLKQAGYTDKDIKVIVGEIVAKTYLSMLKNKSI